jgi:upstream activation factor subunit UAF30
MPRSKTKVAPATEVAQTTESKSTKSRKTEKKVVEKVPVPVSEPETKEEVSDSAVESSDKKKRNVPTRESVEKEFDDLIACLDEEIERLRETTSKSKGVKFLRSVGKRVKTLRTHSLRVNKQRKSTNRKNNSNSGFLKPVRISKELAKFTGWDQEAPRSRVDVTKYICKYIKDHDLQNPTDRRQIRVDDDANLKKLLKFDSKKDKNPLTYYSLQSYLKNHFVATETIPEEVAK